MSIRFHLLGVSVVQHFELVLRVATTIHGQGLGIQTNTAQLVQFQ